MRRSLAILLTGSLLLIGSLAFATGATAAEFGATVRCGNGTDNGGGLGLICQVTVTNWINANGGGSAKVTIRECHGAADAEICTTTTRTLNDPVTRVAQCNGSTEGGGSTLRCRVWITNNLINRNPGASTATINQCNGSGDGIANDCDPVPASTTGAAITQCNGSANGGTLVRLECTATGTGSAAFPVTVNQCNNSGNGGGSLVICSTSIANNRVNVAASPAPTTGPGGGATAPPTDTIAATDVSEPTPNPTLFVGIFLLAFLALVLVASRRSLREIRTR